VVEDDSDFVAEQHTRWTARIDAADPEVQALLRDLLLARDLPLLAKAVLRFPKLTAAFPEGGELAGAKLDLSEYLKTLETDALPSDADFFRLYDTKLLRRETKDYVPKLIAAATIARAPEEYGFRPGEATDPFVYDSIIVPDMTGLDVVAKLAGATTADIRTLNPKYLRLATPPGERSVIRLPVGTGTSVATAYAELPKRERVTFVEHRVARGETLSHIARRYHVSLGALQDANPRVRARSLQVGQRLVIPTGSGTSAALAARRASAAAAPTRVSYHRVRSGDSLWSISRRYGVSSAQLKRLNGLSGDKIRIGQRLRVR